jgi:hypothetical protein
MTRTSAGGKPPEFLKIAFRGLDALGRMGTSLGLEGPNSVSLIISASARRCQTIFEIFQTTMFGGRPIAGVQSGRCGRK